MTLDRPRRPFRRLRPRAALLVVLGLSPAACNTEPAVIHTTRAEPKPMESNLQEQLDETKQRFTEMAPPERAAIYEEGVTAVADQHLERGAPQVGDRAPAFTLKDAIGNEVTLAQLLERGPVVLTWYRGGWCPYCNLQLRAYQEILPEIHAAGAELVALTPETPDNTLTTREKNELAFYVLSDVGSEIAERYGIAYTIPTPVQEQFKGRLDLASFNGDDGTTLPLTATFVIDRDGFVRWRFVDPDYRNRAEPADIVNALRRLQR